MSVEKNPPPDLPSRSVGGGAEVPLPPDPEPEPDPPDDGRDEDELDDLSAAFAPDADADAAAAAPVAAAVPVPLVLDDPLCCVLVEGVELVDPEVLDDLSGNDDMAAFTEPPPVAPEEEDGVALLVEELEDDDAVLLLADVCEGFVWSLPDLLLLPLQPGAPLSVDAGAGLFSDAPLTSVAFRSRSGFGTFDDEGVSGLSLEPEPRFLSAIPLYP